MSETNSAHTPKDALREAFKETYVDKYGGIRNNF